MLEGHFVAHFVARPVHRNYKSLKVWSEWQDLNLRPPASRTHQPAPYPSQYQRLNPTPGDGTNPENDRFRGPACRLRAKDLVTSFAAPTAEGARAGRAVDGHALVFPLPVTASEPLRKVRALAGRSRGR